MSAALSVAAPAKPAPTTSFSALPIRGLLNLFEAFERAADGLASIYTQPRCGDGFGQDEIFDEIERCNDRMQAIVREIETRRAKGTEEKRDPRRGDDPLGLEDGRLDRHRDALRPGRGRAALMSAGPTGLGGAVVAPTPPQGEQEYDLGRLSRCGLRERRNDPVPTGFLGSVERAICARQRGGSVATYHFGDADTRSEHTTRQGVWELRYREPDGFRKLPGGLTSGLRENEGKLLAADPEGHLGEPCAMAAALRTFPTPWRALSPCGWPKRVVEGLEVVNVNEKQAQARSRAGDLIASSSQSLVELPSVSDLGQSVRERHAMQHRVRDVELLFNSCAAPKLPGQSHCQRQNGSAGRKNRGANHERLLGQPA